LLPFWKKEGCDSLSKNVRFLGISWSAGGFLSRQGIGIRFENYSVLMPFFSRLVHSQQGAVLPAGRTAPVEMDNTAFSSGLPPACLQRRSRRVPWSRESFPQTGFKFAGSLFRMKRIDV